MREKILAWDLPIRLFHWSLLILIVLLIYSGKQGGEWMTLHFRCGYAVLTLLLFRLLWGVWGSATARFSDFVRGPRAVLRYLRDSRAGKPPEYPGHNPLGGWSVLALLLVLLIQAGTGLFANDDIMSEGPLYAYVSNATSHLLTRIHHYNFNLLLALIALHVSAVLFYLWVKKDNLIWPMVNGYKNLQCESPRIAGNGRAALLLAIAAGVVYLLLFER
jgi:cytochrome b